MTLPDRGEAITIVEPLIPEEASKHRPQLNDLVLELTDAAAELRGAIPEGMRAPLAEAIRAMNCYYSNLIEGHYTHPVDIERALNDDFSANPEKRDLQLEARAHIRVQAWIDGGGLPDHPLAPESLLEIHRRFCADLPEDLLWLDAPDGTRLRITPGIFRDRDVQVGRHVAPSPGAVPRLLCKRCIRSPDLELEPFGFALGSSVTGVRCTGRHAAVMIRPVPRMEQDDTSDEQNSLGIHRETQQRRSQCLAAGAETRGCPEDVGRRPASRRHRPGNRRQ